MLRQAGRGHARRLPFLFLIRLSLLSQCVFCPVRRRDFDAIPLGCTSGCLFCLVAEAGVRVAVGTAQPGRARHFLAALQLWESGPSARVAVGVGRGTPREKPGPNVRFLHGSHGHGWMCAARCQRPAAKHVKHPETPCGCRRQRRNQFVCPTSY